MRCRMSVHAHSIYPRIYKGYKNLALYLSAEWRLAPELRIAGQALHTFPGTNDMMACLAMMCLRLVALRRVLKACLWIDIQLSTL